MGMNGSGVGLGVDGAGPGRAWLAELSFVNSASMAAFISIPKCGVAVTGIPGNVVRVMCGLNSSNKLPTTVALKSNFDHPAGQNTSL